MAFSRRTSIPSSTDNRYIVSDAGGVQYGGYLHHVILGKGKNGQPAWRGSALPNCVGYCWGRALEMLGITDDSKIKLSTNSARYWYGNTKDGYKRSKTTPKLGAIACWDYGSSGHVAVVEYISPDGSYAITSNSYYGHGGPGDSSWQYWEEATIRKSTGWKHPFLPGGTFQGFIYFLEDEPGPGPTPGPTPTPGPDPHPDINPKRSKFPWALFIDLEEN